MVNYCWREPDQYLKDAPGSITAVATALARKTMEAVPQPERFQDPELGIDDMDCYVSTYLPVSKREEFGKGERQLFLRFLSREISEPWQREAIVCVSGQYVFVEGDTFFSFKNTLLGYVSYVWWLN